MVRATILSAMLDVFVLMLSSGAILVGGVGSGDPR